MISKNGNRNQIYPEIFNLDKFGLKIDSLRSLGNRKVSLHIHFRGRPEKPLFRLRPNKRKEVMAAWYRDCFRIAAEHLPGVLLAQVGSKRNPKGFRCIVSPVDLLRLSKLERIMSIFVDHIEGIKEQKKKIPQMMRFFSVYARFLIKVEGSKPKEYEDRIIMVKATSFEDAENRLSRSFHDYGAPYLNQDGRIVSWNFDRILDVYDTGQDRIDETGTQVYSAIKEKYKRS